MWFLWYMQVHLHVVHGSPEIFGVAESICSARASFSTGIIMGARLTTGCVAAGTSLLGSICERAPLVWPAVWTSSVYCRVEGLVALFEVSREGLVVVLCGAGPIGPCLCVGC